MVRKLNEGDREIVLKLLMEESTFNLFINILAYSHKK